MTASTGSNNPEVILQVRNLTTRFNVLDKTITAVDGISFDLYKNEILAIVGESGSGKSVTNYSIMNLIDPPGIIEKESQINFRGENLLKYNERKMAEIRGNKIAMIFQEPSSSFNPLFRIGPQIGEGLRLHMQKTREEALATSGELLESVHIPGAKGRVLDFPFQMSGGMLQRAMVAQALACSPDILLADEPTTALDVTTQAQILALLKEKSEEKGMSIIFVTHDLALVENFADRVIILYNGRIMETGKTSDVFSSPQNPYTEDLLKAVPRLGIFKDSHLLYTIKGKTPSPEEIIPGCRYSPRCEKCFDLCLVEEPELYRAGNQYTRCHLANK
jgi:peptide/nickel transport system ATP-binding protein